MGKKPECTYTPTLYAQHFGYDDKREGLAEIKINVNIISRITNVFHRYCWDYFFNPGAVFFFL